MAAPEERTGVALAKAELRRSVRRSLATATVAQSRSWDAAICRSISDSQDFRLAPVVVGYPGLRDEARIDPVLALAAEQGRAVYLPVVVDQELRFARWTPTASLVRSAQGVLEPDSLGRTLAEVGPALVLVPGRAFDERGGRIGRGGGFYDRALHAPLPGVTVAGVAYGLQLVESVPAEPHDRRVDKLFTERGCILCR